MKSEKYLGKIITFKEKCVVTAIEAFVDNSMVAIGSTKTEAHKKAKGTIELMQKYSKKKK